MAKNKSKIVYLCSSCGADFPKWHGQCPACNEWGTLSEFKVSNTSSSSINTEKKESDTENFITNFNYIIKFADFYFEDSAIMLKNRLFEEYNIENILIKKLSQNNFRVYKGPYKDFEKLKKGFHNIENLDFDSIEIIKL